MNRLVRLLLFAAFAPLSLKANDVGTSGHRSAESLYMEFCATCHGEQLEGGNGPSLLTQEGRLAGSNDTVAQHILRGAPEAGMPAFHNAINPSEAQALVIYIREMANQRILPERSRSLPESIQQSAVHDYRVERLVGGLDVPWSIAFLPDGQLLFTERTGRLYLMDSPTASPIEIPGLPPVLARDEGGLMAVAIHPDYRRNGWIYLTLSDPGPSGTSMTKVVRGRLRNAQWSDQETIFSGSPKTYSELTRSYGSRMVFQNEYLFFTVGDRWDPEQAQNLASPKGKVHRIFADGRIPLDNPFARQPGALGSIWSYGHRNPQGLALDPISGDLWETEHGPRGGDELNCIRKGANYGWPLATHGMNYDGTPVSDRADIEGAEPPIRHWTPSIASSPIHFYSGDAFPQWKGNLFLGSLAKQQLFRFVVDGDRIVEQELVFADLGRVRDIQTGPDGFLYISLELPGEPGYLIRLVPPEADQR